MSDKEKIAALEAEVDRLQAEIDRLRPTSEPQKKLEDNRESVLQMVRDGATYKEISQEFGVSYKAARKFCKEAGVLSPFAPFRSYLEAGMTYADARKMTRKRRGEVGMDDRTHEIITSRFRTPRPTLRQIAERYDLSAGRVRAIIERELGEVRYRSPGMDAGIDAELRWARQEADHLGVEDVDAFVRALIGEYDAS